MNSQSHEFDVCVIGGGMAGLCAAIAAARFPSVIHARPLAASRTMRFNFQTQKFPSITP